MTGPDAERSGAVDSTSARRAMPVRTCVGCRQRAPKSELLRCVATADGIVPDVRGRLPGRGCHVHPDLGCLELAERRRAFVRALLVPGPVDLAAVRTVLDGGSVPAEGTSTREAGRVTR